jgi:uncharacterized protein (DUF433 family)/DNA-binding transcriptional MerR regulator
VSTVRHLPPRGHYLANEVGWLAGVSGDRIGQWARRGYIRSSQSEGRPRVYSFQDVAEAMVVHELLERGVRHKEIKEAIRTLREEYGDWPLTHAQLATTAEPGARRAAVLIEREGRHYDVGERPWQQVIQPERLRRIAEDLHRGGWVVREVPDLEHIEVDPDRLSGQPTIRGRRIAVQDVAEIAEAPGGVEVLHDDYDLSDAQIEDARRWSRATRELAAA